MPNSKDENDLAALHERLQAARRVLREAYDQRDALAEEIAIAEKIGAGVDPKLLVAFSAAERAVLVAEAEMKDAEYARVVAQDLADDAGP
jgi:microcompartment protein CcmK/EutM